MEKRKRPLKKGSAKKGAAADDGAKQGGEQGSGGANGKKKAWKSWNGGYGQGGETSWKGQGNSRKEKKYSETQEIRDLEARVVAEAPKSGEGLGLAPPGAAESGGQDGPALTGQLFVDLPISRRTKSGLKAAGFVKMTEIQRGAIPHALCGRDVLGEARTGSGKTLAFLVPLMELLFRKKWSKIFGLGGLVVSPTRELAYQIYQVLTTVGTEHDFSAGCIVGGRALEAEQKAVGHMNVLVATPGRLLQHLDESPGFEATDLQMLVLDEADRILDFGFQETVANILGHLPAERQSMLFSATLHTSVHRLGRAALRSPEIVSVHRDAKSRTPERLKQVYMIMPLEKKVDMLFSFLRSHSSKKIIVFVSACKQVRFIYEAFRLLKPGLLMMELHGRQSLTKRLIVFKEFTEREGSAALVCTDIAARGVDFPVVDWVVQVDCPDTVDSYIHRVGRTARYESGGHSALFLLPSEEKFAEKLRAARVTVQSINPKSTKLVSVQGKLSGLLASNGAIRHLAQKAFATYVRSIRLMRDKDVFDVQKLPREAFATSLGLADVPPLGSLDEEADVEQNPMRKQKNMTPLQRLKEKIKAKKEAAKKPEGEGAGGKAADTAKAEADSGEESSGEDAGPAAKKSGRWARRQRRIAALASAAKAAAAAGPAAAENGDGEDLLQPVETPSVEAPATEVRGNKRRLKIQRDGTARGAEGQHVFFGEGASGVGSELGQLADELGGASNAEGIGAEAGGGRQAFLRKLAKDLAARDKSDSAISRARLHEEKKRRARLDRRERQGRDADVEEPVFTLGGASSRSASPANASEDSGAEPSPPPAVRRRLGSSPAPRAPAGRAEAAANAATAAPTPAKVEPAASGRGVEARRPREKVEDSLEAMEREALSRLGGGGLFA